MSKHKIVSQITTDRYINPFTDYGFKRLFGEEPNKDILLEFLNALLEEEQGRIKEISFLKNEQLGALDIDRRAIFDIYCENEAGEKFIVEMPKFSKKEEELETNFDKWLYVLRNLPNLMDRPKRLQEKVFKKLFKVAEIAKFSPEQLEDYEESLKVYRDMKGVLDTAHDEGFEEGIEKGRVEGRAEGEHQKALEIAKNLLNILDSETIAQKTGLKIEEIESLRK